MSARSPQEEAPATLSGKDGSISCSIEETNRLRAQLGLKPLELNDKTSDEIAVAPTLEAKPSTAELRRRIETSRARRAREELLATGSLVDGAEPELDDPAVWVAKMRKLDKKRQGRAIRTTREDEGDEEPDRESETSDEERHLSNVRVTHRLRDLELKAGESVVLTLKDTRLIDDSGDLRDEGPDLLENPDIRANEERKRREKERKKGLKGVYDPLEDEQDEDDILGEELPKTRRRDILHHYDEWAIENKTVAAPEDRDSKRGFALKDLQHHPANQPVQFPQSVDLSSSVGIQKDYLTAEEVAATAAPVQFRKPKKKKNKVALRKIHVDEQPDEATPSRVLELASKKKPTAPAIEEHDDFVEDDYLYQQLALRRKAILEKAVTPAKSKSEQPPQQTEAAAAVVEMVSVVDAVEEAAATMASGMQSVGVVHIKPDEPSAHLTSSFELSGTTEFCKAVRTPLERIKRGLTAKSSVTETAASAGQWREEDEPAAEDAEEDKMSDESEGEDITEEEKKVVEGILAEGLLDGGLASALNYLKSRGELDQDSWRKGRLNHENVPLHVSTDPKDVKLQYKDDYGRVMTPKEAFRYISWVFHGKGPGKKKREKMLRRMELEKKMKTIATNHNKLPTMKALQKEQKSGQAYIVLTSTPSASSSSTTW